MAGSLQVTLRARTFHFNWCNRDETDYVCMRCGTIAVDGKACQHCVEEHRRKQEKLRKFLEQKASERGI